MPSLVPSPSKPPRVEALDALRGIAVLLMVLWHATDAWLADGHRQGIGWDATRVAGGLAAPLFLTAAGFAVGLRIARGAPLGALLRRGAQLIVLGGLLRLQIWIVDAGALLEPRSWPAALAGLSAAALALLALRRRADLPAADPARANAPRPAGATGRPRAPSLLDTSARRVLPSRRGPAPARP
ncbi:MAG TPA: heparan-alpha-glucosaminide N-acetyltransferase domain-containing protein, partial [Sandaracinaceae bacterium LLY-WYZ-13_1]|nr:heparan-alpha-glucosaminide N-acetyltransferase domain-containing protein [Sandaracinaceae bacterium LLY-WYZ-13_1]